MTFPTMETDRLVIRPRAGPPVFHDPAPRSHSKGPGTSFHLGLYSREGKGRLGDIRLRVPHGITGEAEVDLALDRPHWGNGIAGEALHSVFAYLFDTLGRARVRGFADSCNLGAIGFMRSLGMNRETILLRNSFEGGEWLDEISLELTRDQWQAVRHGLGARSDRGPEVPSDFWVVTSFFNPAGYRSHLEKFQIFRERIGAPIVAVELAFGPDFELGPGDADRLLRLRSDQVLWQKERLLNLAIEALPEPCRFVAWVDSDLVFGRPDWIERTREALERDPLVQPFSHVHDLPQGADSSLPPVRDPILTRPSMALVSKEGGYDPADTSPDMMGVCSPGHAWAMRRYLLDQTGLYDARIVGSGDTAMALAALGHAEYYVGTHPMTNPEAKHYRQWAARFHAAAEGRLGLVSGDIYHHWHGDLGNRGYRQRYEGLAPFRFDPGRDIELDQNGAWRWASEKPDLHAYVASYFGSRQEDG